MNEIQQLIKHFIKNYELNRPLENIYIDLVSKIVELGKEIDKGPNYDREKPQDEKAIELGLGDITYSLFSLANKLDIDLFRCLKIALTKYKEIYTQKNNIGPDND